MDGVRATLQTLPGAVWAVGVSEGAEVDICAVHDTALERRVLPI